MTEIRIRLAESNDLGKVGVLFDAYRQFYKMPANLQGSILYLKNRIENGESSVLVAENNPDNILGFCQLYPTYCSVFMEPIFVLYDLFVDPNARQNGIGRKLLMAAEKHALDFGAIRMDLRTAKTNHTAQSLYESTNWKKDEIFFSYSKFLKNIL